MNIALVLALSSLAGPAARAADPFVEVAGTVRDADGRPLAGATVALADPGAALATTSDDVGAWRLVVLPGDHALRAGRRGYASATRRVFVVADAAPVELTLAPLYRLAESVVVQAIRAQDRTPVTKTDLGREAVDEHHVGQEMPFLLADTPSITAYSENGSAGGYAYFFLRGIHRTRINMTLDGVPLNDGEDSGVYFSNVGDFASAVESVQIERGVGAPTVGAASYGGSINFASVDLTEEPKLSGNSLLLPAGDARGSRDGRLRAPWRGRTP